MTASRQDSTQAAWAPAPDVVARCEAAVDAVARRYDGATPDDRADATGAMLAALCELEPAAADTLTGDGRAMFTLARESLRGTVREGNRVNGRIAARASRSDLTLTLDADRLGPEARRVLAERLTAADLASTAHVDAVLAAHAIYPWRPPATKIRHRDTGPGIGEQTLIASHGADATLAAWVTRGAVARAVYASPILSAAMIAYRAGSRDRSGRRLDRASVDTGDLARRVHGANTGATRERVRRATRSAAVTAVAAARAERERVYRVTRTGGPIAWAAPTAHATYTASADAPIVGVWPTPRPGERGGPRGPRMGQ